MPSTRFFLALGGGNLPTIFLKNMGAQAVLMARKFVNFLSLRKCVCERDPQNQKNPEVWSEWFGGSLLYTRYMKQGDEGDN